ncbi:TPA: Ger(x)C family spore germination C-terminal domain-containing protein [Bacillus pacificus]
MKIWLILLLCFFLCTACMLPEKILERQGISTIIGFDLLDENTYKGTISLLQFDRKEEKTSVTISAVGTTSKQIRQNLEQQTSHDLTSGQLRTILFDKYMTEMIGISSFLDTMQRDSSIGSLIFLAITNNAESTINNKNYEEYPEMGSYIYQLLEMELIIEEELNKEFGDILEEFRKLNTDPIGIGRKIKSIRKYSNLNEKDLRGKYSTLNLKPNIKVEIKRTGAVD